MKKLYVRIILYAVMMSVCAVSAFADFGSKPRVEIHLKNAPDEEYYLDLLYRPAKTSSLYDNLDPETEYNPDMLRVLKEYEKDGWCAVMAGGTPSPVFGSLTGKDGVHIFSYVGVPDRFKIIIVTADGDIMTSPLIERQTMEVSLDVDCLDMSVDKKPARLMYIVQFVGSLAATLAIEFIVLLIFRYSLKENLKVFLLTNTFTQLIFSAVFSTIFLYGGTFGTLMAFIPLEAAVCAAEVFIYRKKLTGKSVKINTLYALAANFASALLTYFNFSLILSVMTKLIR